MFSFLAFSIVMQNLFQRVTYKGNDFSSYTNRGELKVNIVNCYLSVGKQLIQHTDDNIDGQLLILF